MRFLSGTQLDLFAGLTPHPSVPVEGTVTAPENTVSLATSSVDAGVVSESGDTSVDESAVTRGNFPTVPSALATFAAADEASPQAILQREARAQQQSISDQDIFNNGRNHLEDRTPPQQGIAADLAPRADSFHSGQQVTDKVADRGIYHPSDAMKGMYEMGDSPSCATCGAIMTRSGSCYRCMSCGSTSGCS
jgi:ribonucleoside-diphosphate reductase alpha chain